MRTTSIFLLFLALGCAPSSAAARPGAPAGGVRASSRAPMTVEWVLQAETADRLTLVARLNRNVPMRIPIAVAVTVPPGLRLVSGRTAWVVEGSESTAPVEETLVFEVVVTGAQEIVLTADAENAGFGVHARKAYRLGQPAQKATLPSSPSPSGPHLEVGGRDFGPSIPVQP